MHWNLQPNLWRTFRRFTTYARHNIRAGLWREWQLAIFVRYAFLLLFAVPAIFAGWWWLVVSGRFMARDDDGPGREIYPAQPHDLSGEPGAQHGAIRGAMPILTVIDLSVAIGSIAWLVRDAGRDWRTK